MQLKHHILNLSYCQTKYYHANFIQIAKLERNIGKIAKYFESKNVIISIYPSVKTSMVGAQWLSGGVLDSKPRGCGFKPHRRHCVVVLEQDTFILAYF